MSRIKGPIEGRNIFINNGDLASAVEARVAKKINKPVVKNGAETKAPAAALEKEVKPAAALTETAREVKVLPPAKLEQLKLVETSILQAKPETKEAREELSFSSSAKTFPVKGKDQDRYLLNRKNKFYGVFDGRGSKGAEYAEDLEKLANGLSEQANTNPIATEPEWFAANNRVFEKFESQAREIRPRKGFLAKVFGKKATDSTAALAAVSKYGEVSTAVAGDSVVAIFRKSTGQIEQISAETYTVKDSGASYPGGFMKDGEKMNRSTNKLAAGDILLIASDGLIYRRGRNDNGIRLTDKDVEAVFKNSNLNPEQKITELGKLTQVGTKEQTDDIAIVLVQVNSLGK